MKKESVPYCFLIALEIKLLQQFKNQEPTTYSPANIFGGGQRIDLKPEF
ncbi:hypothetical protein [Dyadobacter flavalbus]|nr:hypothetical protein [Dyadobacter flavalbus]